MLYCVFALACLMLFIFHWWFIGNDTSIGTVFSMLFLAIFPMVNVITLILVLVDFVSLLKDKTLIKGRK